MLQHPLTLVRAALNGAKLSGLRTEGNRDLVDIVTAKGDKLTLAVDRTTKLPESVSRITVMPIGATWSSRRPSPGTRTSAASSCRGAC